MNTTARFALNGVEITFRKSLRAMMRWRQWSEALCQDAAAPDATERDRYAWIAAVVETVTGLDWTPPAFNAPAKVVEKSYQQFLDAVPDYKFLNALLDTVNTLH